MDMKSFITDRQNVVIIVLAAAILVFSSYAVTGFLTYQPENNNEHEGWTVQSFTDSGKDIELVDGKPVIRMFSTTWCPHCNWAGSTYENVVREYADAGKIIAYHWQLDRGDNTLTEAEEGEVPERELSVYREFNPRGSIPTYVFGGKYYRIGNGFERTKDLVSEEKEFRAMIEQVIEDAGL